VSDLYMEVGVGGSCVNVAPGTTSTANIQFFSIQGFNLPVDYQIQTISWPADVQITSAASGTLPYTGSNNTFEPGYPALPLTISNGASTGFLSGNVHATFNVNGQIATKDFAFGVSLDPSGCSDAPIARRQGQQVSAPTGGGGMIHGVWHRGGGSGGAMG